MKILYKVHRKELINMINDLNNSFKRLLNNYSINKLGRFKKLNNNDELEKKYLKMIVEVFNCRKVQRKTVFNRNPSSIKISL